MARTASTDRLFWFHNDNSLNTRSNLDKAAGRTDPPYRVENQEGGVIGGPIIRGRTFFFGSYQRWTDRRLGSGFTLSGAPTEAGRQVLQAAAGSRPQVAGAPEASAGGHAERAIVDVRARRADLHRAARLADGLCHAASGQQPGKRADGSPAVAEPHVDRPVSLGRHVDREPEFDGQVTPPGLTVTTVRTTAIREHWTNSVLGASTSNEFRVALSHRGSVFDADNPVSKEIPSIEITELGMIGFNAASNRTAIGLAVNYPQFRYDDTYQIQNNLT